MIEGGNVNVASRRVTKMGFRNAATKVSMSCGVYMGRGRAGAILDCRRIINGEAVVLLFSEKISRGDAEARRSSA
jgi:hypothetical protein